MYLFIYVFNSIHNHLSFSHWFSSPKQLFDEKWHQLRLLVTEEDVTLYVDDLEMETLTLEPPVGIFINGKTQVGKYVSKETTAPVSTVRLFTVDKSLLSTENYFPSG